MYDFKNIINRKELGSEKWKMMLDYNPQISEDIIPFSVADMEFKNAPEIIEDVTSYLKEAVWGYTTPTNEYYEAIINWEKRRHNWLVEKQEIINYPGVVSALYMLVDALTNKGEGVITFTPVYYPFYGSIKDNGREVVEVELINNYPTYDIDFNQLTEACEKKENTLMILCSPHNPVGKVFSKDELFKISEICIKNNVLIIADEIHHDLIMKGFHHTVLNNAHPKIKDYSIICTAPSKTFNLAGMITSNIIIQNQELKKRVDEYCKHTYYAMCNIAGLRALIAAYNKCENWLNELLEVINDNAKLVEEFMQKNIPEIKVYELQGTYLQWWDCRALKMNQDELESFMKDEALLFLDEGYIFGKGGIGFERINLAAPTSYIEQALNRLLVAYKKIKS